MPSMKSAAWVRGRPLRDAGDLPLARTGPRRVRGCGRREARRPVHDPQSDSGREAAPGGGLVSEATSALAC
jgi:hypothetical protein